MLRYRRTERGSHKQTGRETDTQIRYKVKRADRHTGIEVHRQIERHTNLNTSMYTDRDKQINGQLNVLTAEHDGKARQAGRRAGRQAGKKASRQEGMQVKLYEEAFG